MASAFEREIEGFCRYSRDASMNADEQAMWLRLTIARFFVADPSNTKPPARKATVKDARLMDILNFAQTRIIAVRESLVQRGLITAELSSPKPKSFSYTFHEFYSSDGEYCEPAALDVPPKKQKEKEKPLFEPSQIENAAVRAEYEKFIDAQDELGKPMTDYSKKLTYNKLLTLSTDPVLQVAIIRKAIERRWRSVYQLTDEDMNNLRQTKREDF